MKVKIRKVYYCEYCKKHSLMPLLKHEDHCTANPNRWCGMCDNACGDVPELIEKYKKQIAVEIKKVDEVYANYEFMVVKEKPNLADIMDDVEGCPACTLTILRCCGLCGGIFNMDFDYKKERDDWFIEKNRDREKY